MDQQLTTEDTNPLEIVEEIKPPKTIKDPPSPKKIISMLAKSGATKAKICKVLADGLQATRPIVADGEVIMDAIDFPTRLKYVETILDVIGEKKLIVDPSVHFHFTNILQQIRAYERGDRRAIEQAGASGAS